MNTNQKQTLLLVGLLVILVVVFLVVVISSFFASRARIDTPLTVPSPTPVVATRPPRERLSPLQKTEIGKTTSVEVERSGSVISKSEKDGVTVYQVRSASLGKTDEIRTRSGVVISERIDTFNKIAGMPPKTTAYEQVFGPPEEIINGVSPIGQYISAYIYAEQGLTIFANRYTKTVHLVHRYSPMTLTTYKNEFADYLKPAPEPPREGIRN